MIMACAALLVEVFTPTLTLPLAKGEGEGGGLSPRTPSPTYW
jgi:hypothetical protein